MKTINPDIQIKDLMTRNVITVSQNTPAIEVARLLITHRIGSVPVLDSNEHLAGMIWKSDLYLKEEKISPTQHTFLSLFNAPVIPSLLSDVYAGRGSKILAADIMSHNAVWILESDSLDDAVQKMVQYKINSLPVLTAKPEIGGRLTGIVTRSDIIRHLISKPEVLSKLDLNLSRLSIV